MKKFANFIVEKKYYILGVMLVILIASACMMPFVEINRDLTKYLPDSSPMKEGLDIMNEEFPPIEIEGAIRVMFSDVDSGRAEEIKKSLEEIPYVDGVDYDSSEKFNKDGHMLFVVKCKYDFGSKEESSVEKNIAKEFKADKPIIQHVSAVITVPTLVITIAIVILAIILLIMCSSWIEPVLFLLTIGIAVIINLGTNLMFGSVSETTFTMTAILQLALSMDYSIILMNRYRLERQNDRSNKEAMKIALQKAFPSIVSSGLTTVIGLLMLVFMKFKIGLDLGRVMAKGVALSMVCVLTVLPALILLFDKIIVKTAKKEPKIPTKAVAKYGYRARKVMIPVFALLFIGTGILQSFAGITFSQPKDMRIDNVFPMSNQLVVLFDNKDEEKIRDVVSSMEEKEDVNLVLTYVNTLGKQMNQKEMTQFVKSLGGEVDEELIALAYYYAKAGDDLPKLTVEELLEFIDSEILSDEKFASYIDEETRKEVGKLASIVKKDVLTEPLSSRELAQKIGIDKNQMDLLFSLYFVQDDKTLSKTMTLNEFVTFLQNTVLKNPIISNIVSDEIKNKINSMAPMTQKVFLDLEISPLLLSQNLKLDIDTVNQIFEIKFGSSVGQKMSAYDFVTFINDEILTKSAYDSLLTEKEKALFTNMKPVIDGIKNDKQYTPSELLGVLSMFDGEFASTGGEQLTVSEKYINFIYSYKILSDEPDSRKMSASGVIDYAFGTLMKDPEISPMFTEEMIAYVTVAKTVSDSVINEKEFTASETAFMFKNFTDKIDKNTVEIIYLLWGSKNDGDASFTMSITELGTLLTERIMKDSRFAQFIGEKEREQIRFYVDGIEAGRKQMKSDNHSLLVLDTSLALESEHTTDFVLDLQKQLDDVLYNEYYIMGMSAMNVEMEQSFNRDLLTITLLTAIAIFIVVAFTFKSAFIPLVLVLLVQCGVFITVSVSVITKTPMYFLALLIVQCILMGATIDYAIVFTNHYIDFRKNNGISESLELAFRDSIHTILTSALIISIITGVIAISPVDPAISQICKTLSIGAISATLLIIFVLPGLLSAFDRWVVKKPKKQTVNGLIESDETVSGIDEADGSTENKDN